MISMRNRGIDLGMFVRLSVYIRRVLQFFRYRSEISQTSFSPQQAAHSISKRLQHIAFLFDEISSHNLVQIIDLDNGTIFEEIVQSGHLQHTAHKLDISAKAPTYMLWQYSNNLAKLKSPSNTSIIIRPMIQRKISLEFSFILSNGESQLVYYTNNIVIFVSVKYRTELKYE